MFLDLRPLRNREYRLLYFGQLMSFAGSMVTYVVLPYQIFQLTHSSFAVGMIGLVQLIPLLLTAFVGGAYADAFDRRKILLIAELMLAGCSAILVLNSLLLNPRVWLIYLVAAVMSGLNGFHRPALNSLTPRLVSKAEIPAVSALGSLAGTLGMVGGPALGGILIASFGPAWTYGVDVATFGASLIALSLMRPIAIPNEGEPPSLGAIFEGFKYGMSRQELIGTYVVDIVAMVFGMPNALFPAMAAELGGPRILGWLYAAPSFGAFMVSLTSRWTRRVRRHGRAVVCAAGIWGVAIVGFGLSSRIEWAIFWLALAGGADMVSAIFRQTLWNETIPDRIRGRMASIEMVSYMSGPLLGNVESGMVAALSSLRFSVISGGVLCVVGVLLCVPLLPRFWNYRAADPVK